MSKRKKKKKELGFNSGISKTSPMCYRAYMEEGLKNLSSNFNIKTYKLADTNEWATFIRGKDYRVQLRWKGESFYEFLVEIQFWDKSNSNKEERAYMRQFADMKLEACKKAMKPSKSGKEK